MSEPKFKPGDMAWSPRDGFHRLQSHGDGSAFIAHAYRVYTIGGYFAVTDASPSLFTLEDAAKLGYFPPKRKVKKTIEGWVNVYKKDGLKMFSFDKDYADESAERMEAEFESRIACVRVTGEYEVDSNE